MRIPYNGQIYEFPDDATLEEMNEITGARLTSQQEQLAPDISRIMQETGGNRTPIDTLKDIATGLGKAGQRIGDTMAERFSNKSILDPLQRALMANGREVPEFIRGQTQQQIPEIDIAQQFGTQGGNPLVQGLSQFGPGAILGGASIPKQVLANALYGYTQGRPGEENLGGFLPSGRTGTAIEGGAGALLPGLLKAGKKGLDYIRPGKSAEEYMMILGRGQNQPGMEFPTAGENIQQLGERIKFGRQSAEQEALIPKTQLMESEGGKRIIPSQKRVNELSNDVANIFKNRAINELNPDRAKSLTKALKDYYQTGDVDQLITKGEEIFEHPGLSEKEIKSVNKALEMEPLKKGKYLSRPDVDKNYKGLGLDEVHAKFEKNPNLENADKLHSDIGKEIRKLEDISEKAGGLTGTNRIKYDRLKANKKALLDDMETYFASFSKEKQALYQDFRTKWASNVPKYTEEGSTIKALSEGNAKGLTREEVESAFKSPNRAVENLLGDIGPLGENNILYNALIDIEPGNAKKLAEALLNKKRYGGYERYIKDEDEAFAKELKKRLGYQKAAKWGAVGLGGLLGGGSALKKFL